VVATQSAFPLPFGTRFVRAAFAIFSLGTAYSLGGHTQSNSNTASDRDMAGVIHSNDPHWCRWQGWILANSKVLLLWDSWLL